MPDDDTLLVPMDEYLKSGIHIGTKFKTRQMDEFIYKSRPDGLFVLNLQRIDERLAITADFLAKYEPEDILVASRRENSWKAVKAFGEATGIRVFAGRYPPGILTNPELKTFTEAQVMLIVDTWPDRNPLKDALLAGLTVVALCDTNNQVNNVDLVLPCNNKGKKSLGLIFYILAKEYLKKKGIKKELKLEDFVEEI
ncbi:MAG: 30S ribosomal protein S2 [Candidatus Woesearchaeota archaeon]